MILEGLTTTQNEDGSTNVAPLGPMVRGDFSELIFRPFPGSVSYSNLKRTGCGVFHVVDEVLLLVQTALDLPHEPPATHEATAIPGRVLVDCCRWYEFRIESIDETGERPVMRSTVVTAGRRRDGWGFNRARHAIIEATIVATRLHLLNATQVHQELDRCRICVDKTGGDSERQALQLVSDYVAARLKTCEPGETTGSESA